MARRLSEPSTHARFGVRAAPGEGGRGPLALILSGPLRGPAIGVHLTDTDTIDKIINSRLSHRLRSTQFASSNVVRLHADVGDAAYRVQIARGQNEGYLRIERTGP